MGFQMDAELIYLIGLDWAEFALRWLHVVTAIAWIGSSFILSLWIWGCVRTGLCLMAFMVRNGRFMEADSTTFRNIWLLQLPA